IDRALDQMALARQRWKARVALSGLDAQMQRGWRWRHGQQNPATRTRGRRASNYRDQEMWKGSLGSCVRWPSRALDWWPLGVSISFGFVLSACPAKGFSSGPLVCTERAESFRADAQATTHRRALADVAGCWRTVAVAAPFEPLCRWCLRPNAQDRSVSTP